MKDSVQYSFHSSDKKLRGVSTIRQVIFIITSSKPDFLLVRQVTKKHTYVHKSACIVFSLTHVFFVMSLTNKKEGFELGMLSSTSSVSLYSEDKRSLFQIEYFHNYLFLSQLSV